MSLQLTTNSIPTDGALKPKKTQSGLLTMAPIIIETAIPLHRDLEEPLIASRASRRDVDEQEDEHLRIDEEVVNDVLQYFQIMGWTLGFILQCVSLGATAALTIYWESIPTANDAFASHTLYWTIYGLSNSWLLLFPVVCFAIERSWKTSGIHFLQKYILNVKEPIVTVQTRRMTFVASVRFLIGVVLGCFMTWGLIDVYLHASYAMLLALFLSMTACLALCQGMIVIYDSFSI